MNHGWQAGRLPTLWCNRTVIRLFYAPMPLSFRTLQDLASYDSKLPSHLFRNAFSMVLRELLRPNICARVSDKTAL